SVRVTEQVQPGALRRLNGPDSLAGDGLPNSKLRIGALERIVYREAGGRGPRTFDCTKHAADQFMRNSGTSRIVDEHDVDLRLYTRKTIPDGLLASGPAGDNGAQFRKRLGCPSCRLHLFRRCNEDEGIDRGV